MPNPLIGPVVGYLGRLRFPSLFVLMVGLMLLSWLWPFDPIPLIDEVVTALAVLILSRWKQREPQRSSGDHGPA